MKHALVSGASGLLGSAVVDRLLSAGWRVTALSRAPLARHQTGLTVIPFDLTQDSPSILPTDASAVVHCAAAIPSSYTALEAADALLRINSLGTLRLLSWAKQTGAARFVNCSSHSVYQRPFPYPIPESHPAYPSGHATYYAVSKLAAEVFASSMNSADLTVCSLRFSSLYGPGMKASGVLYHFMASALRSEAPLVQSHPDSLFDFLYVDDAASAITSCLTVDPSHTVYNVGAGCGVTLPALAETCWAVFGPAAKPQIRCDPVSSEPSHTVLDISRAQRDLGYRPAFDLSTGLHAMRRPTSK